MNSLEVEELCVLQGTAKAFQLGEIKIGLITFWPIT